MELPELPFALTASPPEVWRRDARVGAITVAAAAHTDLYVNPGGENTADAESMMNAATLLGMPPAGDFHFSARVTVDFQAQYDAGVLLLWSDERNWAKFCFEYSPAAEAMVVSVVTREVSDDANAFVVDGTSVWLRIARIDHVLRLPRVNRRPRGEWSASSALMPTSSDSGRIRRTITHRRWLHDHLRPDPVQQPTPR